jgi:predicted nucleic acid-binding protein
MSFLLDTNILSAHLRRPPGLAHRFMQYAGRLYTSSVVLAELFVWAHNRPDPAKLLTGIDELLFEEVSLLNYDAEGTAQIGFVNDVRRSQLCHTPSEHRPEPTAFGRT